MYSQLGEAGQLEGPHRDLADPVPAQSERLQRGPQVVQRPQFQHVDLVAAQVPARKNG